MYEYEAVILRVVDADTLFLDIDTGFDIHVRHKVRLSRIDAPELNTQEGKAARDFVATFTSNPVLIKTIKDRADRYGRYLAEVYVQDNGSMVNLNDLLLTTGLAKPY